MAETDVDIGIEPGQRRPDRAKFVRPGGQNLAGNRDRRRDIGVDIQIVDLQPQAKAGTAPVAIGETAGHAHGVDHDIQAGDLEVVGPADDRGAPVEGAQPRSRHGRHVEAAPCQQPPQVAGCHFHGDIRLAAPILAGPDRAHGAQIRPAGHLGRQAADRKRAVPECRVEPNLTHRGAAKPQRP